MEGRTAVSSAGLQGRQDNQIMKLVLGFVFVVIVAGSIYADYRWKRWIAKQRAAREGNDPNLRS